MKDKELYNSQTQRWADFPDTTKEKSKSKEKKSKEKKLHEKSLYGPFTKIAEAIRKVAETKTGSSTSKMGSTNWVDYHSKSPWSQDRRAAQLRPDALFAFRSVANHSALNESQVRALL